MLISLNPRSLAPDVVKMQVLEQFLGTNVGAVHPGTALIHQMKYAALTDFGLSHGYRDLLAQQEFVPGQSAGISPKRARIRSL